MEGNMFRSADEMFTAAIASVMLYGHQSDSRVGASREVIAWQGRLLYPRNNFVFNTRRKLSPYYAAGELCWYLNGRDDVAFMTRFAPSYKKYASKDEHGREYANGAYGTRWAVQWNSLLSTLRKPESRQAVLSCWNPGHPNNDLLLAACGTMPDIPCTLTLQFLLRYGRLHLVVTMRSNDVWLGMPYDIFCFTTLQCLIAAELGVDVGEYVHQVGSLHIYEKHMTAAAEAWRDRNVHDPLRHMPKISGGTLSMARKICEFGFKLPSDKDAPLAEHASHVTIEQLVRGSLFRSIYELADSWFNCRPTDFSAVHSAFHERAQMFQIPTKSEKLSEESP